MSDLPSDLLYTKEHEWARVAGTTVTVGVTQFAVEQLGDVTQIDLPKIGDVLSQDKIFGTIESVKAVSDLFAPVSGKVIKVNDALLKSPELINDSPYDKGWVVEVELSAPDGAKHLMTPAQYGELLAAG